MGYIWDKTPAQAFTPPTDEKKMGTIWIFVYYVRRLRLSQGQMQGFLGLKVGGGGGVLICKYEYNIKV